ncbi:MAG: hypothetical protein JNL40_01520 [Cyclobacteriaceae bacterium]|nr:hypothetical protein [Cyclobacteriaceae bacterium]
MSSLLPGYEYDLFISYRQKDNRGDKWVTEFVRALKTELDATFKEDISIYFDENPHDGLLETHHVDKSLEGKLKCLVFIPILSQTYCDPKSFAWQHEFCTFNRAAQGDTLGRDIRLRNGNVASRLLPVRIHDLDAQDQAMVELETGSALRAIDFIYKEPGVNRPLKSSDPRDLNLNKTDYRNQVNKVANAVKELVTAIHRAPAQGHSSVQKLQISMKRRPLPLALSVLAIILTVSFVIWKFQNTPSTSNNSAIAVLPFANFSQDTTDLYFADGITEDIRGHLAKLASLQVISRTSTTQFRNSAKSAPEIADQLGVTHILEGNVQRSIDRVRIRVILIDARKDNQVWSQSYDRPMNNLLDLQSEIALAITERLRVLLTPEERQRITQPVTANQEAYDLYVRARELLMAGFISSEEEATAQELLKRAIQLDPKFGKAYALLSYSLIFDFDRNLKLGRDSAILLANQALALDSNLGEAYYARHLIHYTRNQFIAAQQDLQKAHQLEPNDADILTSYGFEQVHNGNDLEGYRMILKSIRLSAPKNSLGFFLRLAIIYSKAEEYETEIELFKQATDFYPRKAGPWIGQLMAYFRMQDFINARRIYKKIDWEKLEVQSTTSLKTFQYLALGEIYMHEGKLDSAELVYRSYQHLEQDDTINHQLVPFRHLLGYTLWKQGRKAEGLRLIEEDLRLHHEILQSKRSYGVYDVSWTQYNAAAMYAFLGKKEKAMHYLDSAFLSGDFGVARNPLFDPIRNDKEFSDYYASWKKRFEASKLAAKQALREFEAGTVNINK